MNRAEYMAQLSYLLQDMAESEKQDVLQYYEDYFDEGGAEQEEWIIRTLGTPERLAAMIKDGIGNGSGSVYGEYTESGYRDDRFREDGKVPQHYYKDPYDPDKSETMLEDKQRNRRNKVLLLIIAVVFIVGVLPKFPILVLAAVVFLFLKYQKEHNEKSKDSKKE